MIVIDFEISTSITEAVRELKAESYRIKERVVAEFNNFLLDSNKSEEDNLKDYYAQWNKMCDNYIDWEQRRYEIAKAALVGELASPVVEGIDPNPSMRDACKWAVKFADTLINELKKEDKQ